MSLFNFKRLIDKYSQGTIKALTKTEGYYDMENAGNWVEGQTIEQVICPGALVPLSNDELIVGEGTSRVGASKRLGEAGTYIHSDRKLYCYQRLEKGTKIAYTNNSGIQRLYTMMSAKDYSDYDTGLYIYILRRADRNDADNI